MRFFILFFAFLLPNLKAQEISVETDSVPTFLKSDVKLRSKVSTLNFSRAAKHAMASMVLPGLGQGLNKTYWKIPLFYVVWGIIIGAAKAEHDQYVEARNALIYELDGDITTKPEDVSFIFIDSDAERIRDIQNNRRRDRDYYIILSVVWYAVGILDAAVTAHLSLDISKQARLSPHLDYNALNPQQPMVAGLKLNINLR